MLTEERLRELWNAQRGSRYELEYARAVEREARREAFMEAAQVCVDHAGIETWPAAYLKWSAMCAAAIRALKEK